METHLWTLAWWYLKTWNATETQWCNVLQKTGLEQKSSTSKMLLATQIPWLKLFRQREGRCLIPLVAFVVFGRYLGTLPCLSMLTLTPRWSSRLGVKTDTSLLVIWRLLFRAMDSFPPPRVFQEPGFALPNYPASASRNPPTAHSARVAPHSSSPHLVLLLLSLSKLNIDIPSPFPYLTYPPYPATLPHRLLPNPHTFLRIYSYSTERGPTFFLFSKTRRFRLWGNRRLHKGWERPEGEDWNPKKKRW